MRANINRAQQLRKSMPLAESILWFHLRDRRFQNLKFRRQHPIGKYIVDFVCIERGLIIELDGSQHQTQCEYDQQRTEFLRNKGFKVVRFWNNEVLTMQSAVLQAIYKELFE